MSRRVVTRRALWLAWLALAIAFGPTAAQEQVDSTRLRIRERLQRLSRPPGFDSILYLQDSLRAAVALEGRRPGVGNVGDSVSAALLDMPGFSLTEYDAGSATFEAEDRILLLIAPEDGRASVAREGVTVAADTAILFDDTSGLLTTTGNATFTPPEGDPVESVSLIYDINEGRGSAIDARTSFREGGANWQVRGDMPFAAQDSTFMSHAQFTSCEIEEPHYHFEANEIKIVGGNVLVARGVRLYFADVPVFWLPFIAQSLAQGRSSGLLTPR
ncbi:MAG TPA: LPS-assembly protein LptD, partial [Gemmatimonadetes bacterium]|nr:LPS-assembly protein LptD [Gemmatimonadota bacterium]